MHAWLAFLAGILTVIAGILIFSASVGAVIYGIAVQIEFIIAILLLVMAGITAWIFYTGVRAQQRPIKTGMEALIGARGIATTNLKPKGEIRVLGEFWQATTNNGEIEKDDPVDVVGMDGMFLVVKAVEHKA